MVYACSEPVGTYITQSVGKSAKALLFANEGGVTLLKCISDIQQPLKASLPISLRLDGNVIEDRELQFSNARTPIRFTVCGIVTDDNDVQFRNASVKIDVISSGIVIDFNALQPLNA